MHDLFFIDIDGLALSHHSVIKWPILTVVHRIKTGALGNAWVTNNIDKADKIAAYINRRDYGVEATVKKLYPGPV